MDNRNRIIDRIETYYKAYLERQSNTLFNVYTDVLLTQVLNIPCCKVIIEALNKKHPIAEDVLKEHFNKEWFSYIRDVTADYEYYISYCLHWLAYIKSASKTLDGYYKKCKWLDKNGETNDSTMLFKTDVIRPILDYIIFQLQEESYILYLLDRYKQRIERFEKLESIGSKSELELQKDLFLFLFDQGTEFAGFEAHNSVSTGNGEMDFYIKCQGEPFVIEVKLYKEGKDTRHYLSQLTAYMSQIGAEYGCLYIFTKEDVTFNLREAEESIYVKTVYIGEKTPCNKETKEIVL